MYSGRVASVEPGSIAEEAGILPGDLIISINGHKLADIIDYRFYSTEEEIDVLVRRGDEEAVISIEKDYDDPLGIEFEDELFDGVRECGNRCIFCFVHQLPRGMRRSLYLRDDDYRLSFLHGNFVTLTNVAEDDLKRIIEQRLSPLYVSVHTTEPELRQQMIQSRNAPDIMQQLQTLAEGGIILHTQIVICPGTNDRDHLARTVKDLASLYPQVASIGIVPVGLTKHRRASLPHIELIDTEGARQIIRQVRAWQKEFRKQFGTRLVWASDELYLVAGIKVPSAASYEGYPQIENGIGLVRQFIDDLRRTAKRFPERLPYHLRATLVTSTLAAPVVEELADVLNRIENLRVKVVPIINEFFGESVTVAGLITGKDIKDRLMKADVGDVVTIPSVMLRDGVFLDDMTVDELSAALNRPVIAVEPRPTALVKSLIHIFSQSELPES